MTNLPVMLTRLGLHDEIARLQVENRELKAIVGPEGENAMLRAEIKRLHEDVRFWEDSWKQTRSAAEQYQNRAREATDIVERLRIRQPLLGTLCDEAAAEIERLHALLDNDAAEIMRLIREIDRLRALVPKP